MFSTQFYKYNYLMMEIIAFLPPPSETLLPRLGVPELVWMLCRREISPVAARYQTMIPQTSSPHLHQYTA
jgi:hypothetical protein